MSGRLAGNAARVALLSGLVGVALILQEGALAYRFGVSDSLAAFQIAFLWVSLLWNVLAGGTLLQALIPTYVWASAHLGAEAAAKARAALSGWLLAAIALIAVAFALVVPQLYDSPLVGLGGPTAKLAGMLFAMMAPTLVLQGLAAMVQARLNIEGRFALPAFTPIFPPLCAVAATLAFGKDAGVLAAAGGVLVGQTLQTAVLMFALPGGQGIGLRGASGPAHRPALRSFFGSYGMLVGAALLLSGVFWVGQAAAAHLGAQAVAHLAYANRPVFLFAALATVAVANVALTGFTEDAARSNHEVLKEQLARGIRWIIAISAFMLPVWGLLTPEIVALLYERGAFSAEDTAVVASLQRWALAQIPFFLTATLAWRMLNALRANGLILAATSGCFAINAALVIPLSKIAGIQGIFAGTAAAFALWSLALVMCVRRRLR